MVRSIQNSTEAASMVSRRTYIKSAVQQVTE